MQVRPLPCAHHLISIDMRRKTATIIETELIDRLSAITGHNRNVVRDIIRAQTEFVLWAMENNTPVRIGNIVELEPINCTCAGGFNFATGVVNPVKQSRKVKFKPTAALRRAIGKK